MNYWSRCIENCTTFFVNGEPKGKGRPRFGNGRAYTPKATADYEKHIRECYTGDTLTGAVFVDIVAFFRVPKSYTKKQKEAVRDANYPLRPTKKPDADNIIKAVLDALNGVAYEDDKQVVDVRITKYYSFEKEGLQIKIGGICGV